MSHKLNSDRTVAVALDYYWQPMSTCPVRVKVQLLGQGGVAYYGTWNGKDSWPKNWAPVPRQQQQQNS